MTLIYISIAFIAGIFFHKVYSALGIIVGLKSGLLHTIENEVLFFVLSMYAKMLVILEGGYMAMQISGTDPEKIKLMRNDDAHDMQEWKNEMIREFIEAYPPAYKGSLTIETWDDAMDQVAIYKAIPPEALRDENPD